MEKCKIRFLINTLGGGGAEKVLVELVRQLDKTKYDISVLSVTGGVHAAELPPEVQYTAIVRQNGRVGAFLAKLVYKLPKSLFCRLFMQHEKNDIEVAYLEGFPTAAVAALQTTAKKLAFIHCDVSVNNMMQGLYPNNAECLAQYAAFQKVCFVSEGARKGFFKSVGSLDNTAVVHNVLDTAQIVKRAEAPSAVHFSTDGMKILSIGRLTYQKQYDRLLRIAGQLEKEGYRFEILIAGEGEERPELERILQENAVTSVKLIGFQENPYALMREADLFVCSSVFEGYSTVVTESAILGLPVLTTDCAGMDEILDGGKYGKIVENSENALLKGLRTLLADGEEFARLQAAAKSRSEMLLRRSTVEEYDELFKEVTQ